MSDDAQSVGDNIHLQQGEWRFSGEVPQYFGQHVRRSVPLYDETHQLILAMSDEFLRLGDRVYDVGCSTGTLTRLLAERHTDKQLELIGLDAEPDMIDAAAKATPYSGGVSGTSGVRFAAAEVQDYDFEPCGMVVACFTLQFSAVSSREQTIQTLYNALRPGGILVLAEKVAFDTVTEQALQKTLYYNYKRRQGYTEAEIKAKELSLQGVMEPVTEQQNIDWLYAAGFSRVHRFMQHSCFCGWLAVK